MTSVSVIITTLSGSLPKDTSARMLRSRRTIGGIPRATATVHSFRKPSLSQFWRKSSDDDEDDDADASLQTPLFEEKLINYHNDVVIDRMKRDTLEKIEFFSRFLSRSSFHSFSQTVQGLKMLALTSQYTEDTGDDEDLIRACSLYFEFLGAPSNLLIKFRANLPAFRPRRRS